LRLYAGFGCTPLRLVKNAWKPDTPSKGYGVLCEFKNPSTDSCSADGALIAENTADNDQAEATEMPIEGDSEFIKSPGDDVNFMRKALNWAKARKKGLIVSGLVLSTAVYEGLRG